MKVLHKIAVVSALALGTLPSIASAADYMRVNVPFAFVVAGKQFAPGEYVISQSDAGVILVQGGGNGAAVISTPASASVLSGGSSLHFTNSQEQLHHTSVSQQGGETRSIPVRAVDQRTVTISSR